MWVQDEMNQPITKSTPGYWLNGVFVPNSFIYRELIPRSAGGNKLVPQGTYSEGSNNRKYYQATVEFLVGKGVATEPRGPKGAVITSWNEALAAIRSTDE